MGYIMLSWVGHLCFSFQQGVFYNSNFFAYTQYDLQTRWQQPEIPLSKGLLHSLYNSIITNK